MKTIRVCLAISGLLFLHVTQAQQWVSLFDGKTLSDWKVGDNASTFSVDSGMIKVNGNTANGVFESSPKVAASIGSPGLAKFFG